MAKKVPTLFEMTMDEFFQSAAEVRRAQTNFNNAEPQFFEIANAELSAAIAKFEAVSKKIKLIQPNQG